MTESTNSRSKDSRASIALLFFIIAAHIAYFLPQTTSITEVTQSYPSTACPGSIGDAKATALLPNKSVQVRDVSRPKSLLRKNGLGSYSLNQGAILVEGNAANTVALQSRIGKWTAATICTVSDPITWFVGGTANVTSQSKIVLVNSGLSDAVVDLTSYSENGPTQTLPVSVKSSSEKIIRVDALDPGSDRIVVKVETRSGRVTAFLLDERVRGLTTVGGDFVASAGSPSKEILIPALPIKVGNGSTVRHRVRIMTTGKIDATASIEIISPDGVFIPVGFGNLNLSPQIVRDIDLREIDLGSKTFALKISSSEPVVGGVFTEVKSGSISDYMWSSPASRFGSVTMNLYGLEPIMSFASERIHVDVSWRDNRGNSDSKTLIGDEIVNWRVPSNTRSITIVNRSGAVGSMTWLTRDGITHLPISPSTNLESATKPIADISVILPRN